jgi:hypothetical protein
MLKRLSLCLLAALASFPARAQTTGVAGRNDYTINGSTPGSTSCPLLCFPSPATLNLWVTTVPGNPVIVIWNGCPCRPCVTPWPPNGCVPPIPPATFPPCSSTTNQSIDMLIAAPCPILFSAFLLANSAGLASMTLTIPLLSTPPCTMPPISTQAVVIDPCGVGGPPAGPGPFVLTQAYSVRF